MKKISNIPEQDLEEIAKAYNLGTLQKTKEWSLFSKAARTHIQRAARRVKRTCAYKIESMI